MSRAAKFSPKNITVRTEHGRTVVMWETDEPARFHVWVNIDTLAIEASCAGTSRTLFKNPAREIERHAPGFFDTRRLDVTVKANAEMIATVFAAVKQLGMIETAIAEEKARREAERVEHEKAVRENKIKEAALDLHAALQALMATEAMHPGAKLRTQAFEQARDALAKVPA